MGPRAAQGILPVEIEILLALEQPRRFDELASRADWHAVARLAGYHRLEGRLAGVLGRVGPVSSVPADVASSLARARARNERRYREAVLPQLEALSGAFLEAGITPTVLKGAALVSAGLLVPGDRGMADVDLLVPRERRAEAQTVVEGLGYRPRATARERAWAADHHYQDAPLRHPDFRLGLDLHWHVQSPRHRHPFDVGSLRTQQLVLPSGRCVLRLTDNDQLAHLCLHFWSDRRQGRPASLGQLWDVRAAARRLSGDAWLRLAADSRARGHPRKVAAVVALGHLLLDVELPTAYFEVVELAADQRLHSFAFRRVLAPRPDHLQMVMVTAGVPYRGWRLASRVARHLIAPGQSGDADRSWRLLSFRRARWLAGLLLRLALRPRDTRAELRLDRWAHDLR